MAVRRLLSDNAKNTAITHSLLRGDSFAYAHLVKFEKPIKTAEGDTRGQATDYSYITDGSHDIIFDDGSTYPNQNTTVSNGAQTYIANKLLKVGSVGESTTAKASNINLTLAGSALGISFQSALTITASNTITATVDFVENGFREGDVIHLLSGSGANDTQRARIDRFSNGNLTAHVTPTFKDDSTSDDDDLPEYPTALTAENGVLYSVNFDSPEIESVLTNRAATSYARYINRDVFIYKAHIATERTVINSVTYNAGDIIGAPFLIFKGIIATAKLTESPEKDTTISWGLTSHWGDFVRVNGRLTSDTHHRALNPDGTSDPTALKKAAYEHDLGFLHSEQAVNLIATYDVSVTKTRLKKKKKWFGLKTEYSQQEYQVQEEREADLRFNLDAKYLPVIYGVGKVSGIPVFVDTLRTDASTVFVAYAICEGEVGGIYDIHFDGTPSVCIDGNDFDTRSSQTSENTVDVLCYGRADRGDTLDSKTITTGATFNVIGHSESPGASGVKGGWGGWGNRSQTSYVDATLSTVNTTNPSAASASTQGAGITHGKGAFFDVPIDTLLQFQSGKHNQKANALLVQNRSNFKVGNDYYEGTEDYWGAEHQLLDTAYAVCRFRISEGETTIPTPEFVMRGKPIDCFNYDHSYELHSSYGSANLNTYNIGDLVTLKRTSDDTVLDGQYNVIADIYYITTTSGAQEARVRLRDKPTLTITDNSTNPPTVTPVTSFYVQKAGLNSIFLRTWDDVQDSGNVGGKLEATITSASASSGNTGADITMSSASSAFKTAINPTDSTVAIHENGGGAGNFGRDLVSEYQVFNHTSGSNTVTNIGNTGTNSSTLVSKKVVVKDAIQLDKVPTGGGPGKWLKFKKKWPDGSYPKKKKRKRGYAKLRIKQSLSDNVMQVEEVIDAAVIPESTDSYEMLSSVAEDGPEDTRISLNPAMQLLDYLTNDTYGRELDIDTDIDLESFLAAARDCDTRSDVTLVTTSSLTATDEYLFTVSGKVLWYGVVKSSTEIESGRYNTVFTKVSGKLAHRWENWKYFYSGELYYYEGALHQASSNGVISSTPSTTSSVSSLNITKKNTSTNVSVEITKSKATFDGNPVVKVGAAGSEDSSSGYSLYDGDDVKYWRFLGWDAQNQRHVTRHQLNTVIDTSRPVFENVNTMLNQFNGVLRYSAGKYSLAIEKASEDPVTETVDGITYTIDDIGDEDIIGQINVEDRGQKGTYNSVSVSIEDPQNRFESRQISMFNSTYLKQDRSIKKDGKVQTPDITNYYNARINAKQYLDQSRASLKVNFTMGPKGLLHSAGDIIRITNSRFGWSNKLYRITNLTFTDNCLVQVTAEEHDDNSYLIIPERTTIKGVDGSTANKAAPPPPTSLSATNNKRGGIQLDWVNPSTFNSATSTVEIYRATSNNRSHSSLKKIGLSKSDTFTDPIIEEGLTERYYWIRYAVNRPQQRIGGIAPTEVFSTFEPSSATGAAVGSAAGAVDGISISMSNDNATVVADEAGTVSSFANTGTAIKVFITGGSPITYDNASPYQNNSFRIASATVSGVTAGAATEGTNIYSQANITAMPGDTGTITYSIIVKDAIGTERTFEKIQTFTKSKRGEFGKTAELVANKYVINYSTAGTESDSLTFTGTARNFGATTPYFEFFVNGLSAQASAVGSGTPPTKSFTLADSDEPAIGATKTIKLQIRENSASGAIVAEDSVSIYGVQDGSDAVTGFLTNEAHTVGANFEGSSNVGAAGGDFRVFVGGTNVTTSCTFSVVSESGVDMSIGSSSGTYTVTNFPDANTGGTALFRAVVPAATAGTQNNVIVEKTYTISKAKSSSPVIKGELTNSSHSFTADVSGNISSSDLTAGGGTFTVTKDGVDVSSNSNVTFSRVSQSGITTSINNNGVYTISAFPSSTSTGTATFRATIASSFTGTGSAQTIDLVYTASKGKTGADGVSGTAIRELTLFYQFNAYGGSQPSTPTSGTYNFSSGVIASIAAGWSQTRPSTEIGKIVYQSTALATESSAGSGVSGTLSWSTPSIGDKGVGDVNFIFQYSTNQPTTPSAIGVFTNGGIPTGWSDSPPTNPNDGRKLWSSKGKAELTGNISSGFAFNYTWETPVVHVQEKSDVGLANTEDKSSQDIRDEIVEADIVGSGKTFTVKPNKIELDNFVTEEGRLRFKTDGGSFVTLDPFSSSARTQIGRLRAGQAPDDASVSILNSGITLTKVGSSVRLGGGGTGDQDVTLAKGDVGLGNVINAAQVRADLTGAPGAILNSSISLTKSGTAARLSGTGVTTQDVTFVKGDVGLGSVDNLSASSIRSGTTKTDVGLGNVDNLSATNIRAGTTASDVGLGNVTNESKSTMFANPTFTGTVAGVTKTHVGLGSVDNLSASTIRSGTSKTDVGLGNVDNLSASSIRSGTTKTDVGLANVDNLSASSIRSGTTATDVGLGNVTDGADITGDNTSNDTSNVNGVAASTVQSNASKGAVSITASQTFCSYQVFQGTGTGADRSTSPANDTSITVSTNTGDSCTVVVDIASDKQSVSASITVDSSNRFSESGGSSVTEGNFSNIKVTHDDSGKAVTIGYGLINNREGSIVICCFTENTLIDMRDGSKKQIKDIELGDLVVVETGTAEVVDLHPTTLGDRKLYSINGGDPFVTSEHPFRTEDGWKSIDPERTKLEREELYDELNGALQIGDKVLKSNGLYEEITEITAVDADPSTPLYNFTVNLEDHSYFANEYCVHNK